MDWAPVTTATANQILAVAPYRNRYDVSGCGLFEIYSSNQCFVQFFQMETSFVAKGNIQIWDVGEISTVTETPPTPQLLLTVAHEFGIVREMRWCPSGCYDDDDDEREGEERLPRLGLLAVASSDGFVRILKYAYFSQTQSIAGTFAGETFANFARRMATFREGFSANFGANYA